MESPSPNPPPHTPILTRAELPRRVCVRHHVVDPRDVQPRHLLHRHRHRVHQLQCGLPVPHRVHVARSTWIGVPDGRVLPERQHLHRLPRGYARVPHRRHQPGAGLRDVSCRLVLPGWCHAGESPIAPAGTASSSSCAYSHASVSRRVCYAAQETTFLCPPGYWCAAGVGTPTACVAGTYNSLPGQGSVGACITCPAGEWPGAQLPPPPRLPSHCPPPSCVARRVPVPHALHRH